MMFSPRPSGRTPFDATPHQRQWMRRTDEQLESLSRFEGEDISGGTLPAQVPPLLGWIFGKIRNEEDDSSGSSSTDSSHSSSLLPPGAGFADDEGYLAFAIDQIYDAFPWKGIVVKNGISTSMPTSTRGGANYAYPLNQDFYEAGTNVILKKAGKHWVIIGTIGGLTSSSDSTHFCFDVDCENGTIVVTDCGSSTGGNSSSPSNSSGHGHSSPLTPISAGADIPLNDSTGGL